MDKNLQFLQNNIVYFINGTHDVIIIDGQLS